MKHLKYIKEYFDTDDIKDKSSFLSQKDIENMTKDSSMLTTVHNGVEGKIIAQIKSQLPYFKRFDIEVKDDGIYFSDVYEYSPDENVTFMCVLTMRVQFDEKPMMKTGHILNDMFYTLEYDSIVFFVSDLKGGVSDQTPLFKDKYNGTSIDGSKNNFKSTLGAIKMLDFLRLEMIPLMNKTLVKFKEISGDESFQIPTSKYNKNIN